MFDSSASCVCSEMSTQCGRLGEGLITLLALVGLFPGMDSHMALEVVLAREPSVAVVTDEVLPG